MKSPVQISLHSLMTAVFLCLILGIGGAIAYKSYQTSRQLVMTHTTTMVDLAADRFTLAIERTYHPIGLTLELFSQASPSAAKTPDSPLNWVPIMIRILETEMHVRALLIGHDNGEYFSVGRFQTQSHREALGAPEEASFYVTENHLDEAGKLISQHRFLDAAKQVIAISDPFETPYDPRKRPWYQMALADPQQTILTSPYVYASEPVLGITMARQNENGRQVFAADITLQQAAAELSRQKITPGTQLLLHEPDGLILADSQAPLADFYADADEVSLRHLDDAQSGPLTSLPTESRQLGNEETVFYHDHQPWLALSRVIGRQANQQRGLLVLIPLEELLADALASLKHSVVIAAVALLLALPLTWWISRILSRPIQELAAEARRIQHFDFSKSVAPSSRIREIRRLATALEGMRSTIARFLELITSLSNEQHFEQLLKTVEKETRAVSGARRSLLWILDDKGQQLVRSDRLAETESPHAPPITEAERLDLNADQSNPLINCLSTQKPQISHWAPEDDTLPVQLRAIARKHPGEPLHCLSLPLSNRGGDLVGILTLVFITGEDGEIDIEERASFVEALSGFAAVTIESQHLIRMQKRLLDSFIQLLAGAIDAKSPYTGGHCQRVPELTNLIAQAACDASSGPYASFDLDEKSWEAVRIAGWLHDCGKITSPEYVIDKATKLETLYDRIHEIRMRFEVLKRDAEVNYWRARCAGEDESHCRTRLDEEQQTLDEEFAFVAACNQGGEAMTEEDQTRLHRIAQRRWLRTLDDRLGISWEEAQRKNRSAAATLPVEECLLDNKEEHRIERPENERISADNPWGFQLRPPEFKYDRGELYNLCINRGTLTDEERYMINDHIVQTIIMLERLPFPRHLQSVPELAGGHHEKMDGTGYPRGLTGEDMSPVARMMAIADIFEALTASDRPYKKPKTLSESLAIMARFSRESHIDPSLFRLFLESGVYREYAERHLQPEQIDEVDISEFLASA